MQDSFEQADRSRELVATGDLVRPSMIFCAACGADMARDAPSCRRCGAPNLAKQAGVSQKRMVPAALLCFFLGTLGAHRFYVGKIFTGLLMIVTLGGLGIWAVVDLVRIIVGSFRDKHGLLLQR